MILKALFLTAACLFALPVHAQDNGFATYDALFKAHPPQVIPVPADLTQIPLSTTGSPSSDIWTDFMGGRMLRDVTQPALIPVLPKAGTSNGAAIIIAPGGAFLTLSIDSEGLQVAQYLADRGFTCFVLKYRLDPTPADNDGLSATLAARFSNIPATAFHGDVGSPATALAQADGLSAMAYVRSHAATYGIDTHRIGFMGFSAGGMTTMNVATAYDAASRPDFIGVIYGASPDRPVPADAPPAFIAVAADDPLLGHASVPIFEAWRTAGKDVELHIYAHGGHGFGMRPTGTTTDHWIEDYYNWLVAEHLTAPAQ